MRLLDEIKHLLRKYNIRPKKRLGQSFCVDDELLKRMVAYSNLCKNDIVLEIGSGFGFLTRLLSEEAKQVIAVEFDLTLLKALRSILKDSGNIAIVLGNILELKLPKFNKVVANPPYSISSQLILNLFKRCFDCAVLTFQKEFAERLVAKEGTRNYGSIAVITDYKAYVNILEYISRDAFYPKPNVESAVVLIEIHEPKFKVIDEKLFFMLVNYLFTQRNKKTRKPLESFLVKEMKISKSEARLIIKCLPFVKKRVRNMESKDFGVLSNKVYDFLHSKRTIFKCYRFYVFPKVYEPSEDTFLLAEHLDLKKGEKVLDMGTGCGLLGILAAKKAESVVAVDNNSYALECTSFNAMLNHVDDKVNIILSDLFSELMYHKFDLIIFNPPYLPIDANITSNDLIERAWCGGYNGRKIIDKFLSNVDCYLNKNGRILMVQSSLSNPEKSIKMLKEMGFEVDVVAEKELFFEQIVVIQANK